MQWVAKAQTEQKTAQKKKGKNKETKGKKDEKWRKKVKER